MSTISTRLVDLGFAVARITVERSGTTLTLMTPSVSDENLRAPESCEAHMNAEQLRALIEGLTAAAKERSGNTDTRQVGWGDLVNLR